MNTTLDHLRRLYAHTDDPWNFESSAYEQDKFAATRRALSRSHYEAALELGCGNGALARHLAPLCASYFGIDAIGRAVLAAQKAVPDAQFVEACYPCLFPDRKFDLVILSEVLYFLSPDDISRLARDLVEVAPRAEIICTTYLGDTEQSLQGCDALQLFTLGVDANFAPFPVVDTGTYRIDRFLPRGTA